MVNNLPLSKTDRIVPTPVCDDSYPHYESEVRSQRSQRLWLAGLLVCIASAPLIFLLPLAIPVRFVPAISASYTAGFNNQVAAIATAIISIAVMIWSWKLSPYPKPKSAREHLEGHVGPLLTGAVIVASCIFFAACGWMLARSGLRYIADAGYFIEQMSSHAEYGGVLYSHLEFAYGPLLFYPTVWLQSTLRCGWLPAYFTTLAVEQSLGLLEFAYLLNAFPISPKLRRFAFVLLALGALNPLLGLNYTFFRFLTPFFLLVFGARLTALLPAVAFFSVGGALCLGISVEIGVAFAAGVFAFGLLRARLCGWTSLWIWGAPIAGAVGFYRLVGPAYLQMLRSFAKGALNLPVAPYPHLLVFLFAVVWLVPCYLGWQMRHMTISGATMVSCYAIGIGLLPVALGRCDPLHVFFNGAGLLVLSLAAIQPYSRAVRATWFGCLVVFVLWQQGINNKLFRFRTADILSVTVMPHLPLAIQHAACWIVGPDSDLADHLQPDPISPEYALDVSRLERSVGHALVATPLEIAPATEDALKRSHHYRPDYFAFGVDLFSAPNEARKIQELDQAQWALIPSDYSAPFIELPSNLGDLQGFTFPYRLRHPIPFQAGAAIAANLSQSWVRIDELGPYILLRHKPN